MNEKTDIIQKRSLIFVTGISGAGKTTALSCFIDLEFHCIDNLPLLMIDNYLKNIPDDQNDIAIGLGLNTIGYDPAQIVHFIEKYKNDYNVHLLFLRSRLDILQKRFALTGLTHPLCHDGNLEKALEEEYELNIPLLETATSLIDTSDIGPKELRRYLIKRFDHNKHNKQTTVIISSFGFKYGLPKDAETVFDARILQNPHWDKELAHLTGRDAAVQAFLLKDNNTLKFINHIYAYLENAVLPFLEGERRFYHIAIGCTGGHHRSVFVAEKLYEILKSHNHHCRIFHKTLE